MSKAVLISIQPKWCEKIANGEKTVEVRKSRPRLEPPFKCYIYCTKPRFPHEDHITLFDEQRCFYAGGKVIGEFVCDRILDCRDVLREPTCLTLDDWLKYTDGHKGPVYGWHISGLQIYKKPKELSEFMKPCENDLYCEICAMYSEFQDKCGNKALTLSRPPQSWCYVEELPEGGRNDG